MAESAIRVHRHGLGVNSRPHPHGRGSLGICREPLKSDVSDEQFARAVDVFTTVSGQLNPVTGSMGWYWQVGIDDVERGMGWWQWQ